MAWIYALLSLSLLLLAYQNWSFGGTLFILSVVMLILARQKKKKKNNKKTCYGRSFIMFDFKAEAL